MDGQPRTTAPAYYEATTFSDAVQGVVTNIDKLLGSLVGLFAIPIKMFELSFAWVTPLVATIDSILAPFAQFGGA